MVSRTRMLLVARLAALALASALSATGTVLTLAIVDAGPRNVARESVDRGAVACGRVGAYESLSPDYAPPPSCANLDDLSSD